MICLVRIAGSIMFVWCNGLYHVCLVYCFDCCSILSYSHYAIYGSLSCLYGVPLVSARGRTHVDGPFRDCLVYRLRLLWSYSIVWCIMCLFGVLFCLSWSYSIVWCIMCLFGVLFCLSWSYSIVWCIMCLFGVPFTSVVVILDCVVYHVFIWCTVLSVVVILDCMVYQVFVWCTVYVCRGHTRLRGVPCVCLVYRLRLSWSYSIVGCTMFVWCSVYVCRGHTRLWGVPCLFVYRLRSVVVTLDGGVYHMFACVPFTF